MFSSKVKWHVFISPLFVLALLLLIINDHFLKHQFTSRLTGKLSDFAGLFIFAEFFFALFPRQTRAVVWATALAFVYWKSPLSQPLIDQWNSLAIVAVNRTVDASDLIALVILPIARLHFLSFQDTSRPKILAYPIAFIALFGIMGTSVVYPSRSLQFEMQDGLLPSLGSIHGMVDEVAYQHLLKCVECDPKESHRRYGGEGRWLEANFDAYTKTLFIRVSGRDEKETMETAERIRSAISARLKSVYKNVTVKIYQPETQEAWVRSSIKAQLSGARFPFLCPGSETSPEIISLFQNLDAYARTNAYKDLTKYSCFLTSGLCRYYVTGRITGPYEFSRSTSLEMASDCAWGSKFIKIDIEQKTEDKAIDASKIILELRGLVEKFTRKDAVVETSGRGVPN